MDQGFYKELLNSLAEGVYYVNRERKITFWNKAAERISGYAAEEVMGKSCADNVLRHVDEAGTELCLEGCPLTATLGDGVPREASVFLHHRYGHRLSVFVRVTPMRDDSGAVIGAVEIFTDNSRQLDILHEIEKLRKEVLTDALTGLGNRRYADITMERLDHSMEESGVPFGVALVDIDHFKRVNDTWGHAVGDLVLTMVARTLKTVLRPLDATCRWGGEEFAVFISNTTRGGMSAILERLRMLIEKSWLDHGDEKIQVTASLGGAMSSAGESAAAVVKRADRQLYLAKDAGRNRAHFDDPERSS